MGERKVLNKYYPPDFDHTLIPKRKQEKNRQYQVRMMLPMSVSCLTCGEYMYRGKKFNSKTERVDGEEGTYLGIRILRFYMKCTKCNAEFTILTDPKNSDYKCETGVQRNHEIWKEEEKHDDDAKKERDEAEEGDAMKALELRTEDSKREMDQLDALDEIKAINKRHLKINTEKVLELTHDKSKAIPEITADEEAKIKELFSSRSKLSSSSSSLTESSKPSAMDIVENVDKAKIDVKSLWDSASFAPPTSSDSHPKNNLTGAVVTTIKPKPVVKIVKKEQKRKISEISSSASAGGMKPTSDSDDVIKKKPNTCRAADSSAPNASRHTGKAAESPSSDDDVGGGSLGGLVSYGKGSSDDE